MNKFVSCSRLVCGKLVFGFQDSHNNRSRIGLQSIPYGLEG